MGELRKVVLATRNPDKVRELGEVFAGLPFTVVAASDYPGLPEVIEDGTTILGNATRKAIVTAAYTGEIALADDTSFQVRELNGWPDIFAARFAGEDASYHDNAELTLDLLREVPAGFRQARFATACCWVDPRPELVAYSVPRPAVRRWLRNPWGQGGGERGTDYWDELGDRPRVWREYVSTMTADLVSRGHDREHLAEVVARLLSAADAESGVRLPDSRIWAVPGPDTKLPPVTRAAPSGLPADAAGRRQHEPFWLEISTGGRLLGAVAPEPVGTGGFGYDPIFLPVGELRTLAEMPAAAKHAISHRGRAVQRLTRAVRCAYGLQSSV